jgi:predicted MFS family arabinose efflux permease
MAIYGLAGLGVAAFTPSALSLVADAAPRDKTGHAYAWYATAHYGAIGIGPYVGGLAAEWWGYRTAFVVSGVGIALALGLGAATRMLPDRHASSSPSTTFADVKGNAAVWAWWIISASGLLIQGVVFPFFPLLGQERGLGPAAIGLVFLALGLANTAARLPAGWLLDRTGGPPLYAVAGVLLASAVTALLPQAESQASLLVLVTIFGATSGIAFVAISVALAASAAPSARGLVMGGYSTSLYLGFALGSLALGPIITRHGYGVGFVVGGTLGTAGAFIAAVLWARAFRHRSRP